MHRIRTILQARISDRILSAAEHMVSSRKDFDGTILMILAAPGMSGKEILVRDLSASSALAAYRGRMPAMGFMARTKVQAAPQVTDGLHEAVRAYTVKTAKKYGCKIT